MVDYREIRRLHSLGTNKLRIAEALHSSCNTETGQERRNPMASR